MGIKLYMREDLSNIGVAWIFVGEIDPKIGDVGSNVRMASVTGILNIIFAASTFQNNLSLLGLNYFPQPIGAKDKIVMNYAVEDGDVQVINSYLRYGDYDVIVVKNNIPVKWVITAEKKNINGCNNEIIIPKYDIDI